MSRPAATQMFLKLWMLLLFYIICTTEAYYSTQREGGNVTWSFPETPPHRYHDHLGLAGQIMRQHSEYSKLQHNTEAVEELNTLLRGFQKFQGRILASVEQREGTSFVDGFSFENNVGDGDNDEEKMMVDSMMAALDDLARAGGVTDRCVNDTGFLLVSMVQGQGWALKFLDATGKPGPGLSEFRVNFLGDYDLCRKQVSNGSDTTFRGNYVTWNIALGPPNPMNPLASLNVQWGVCMPDTCTDTENTLIVKEVLQFAGLNGTLFALPAVSHTDHREASAATVAAIIILCIIGTLMFAGTLYDVLFLQWPVWRAQWLVQEEKKNVKSLTANGVDVASAAHTTEDDDEPLIIKADIQQPPPTSPGKLVKALLAFSVYTNGSKVLNTTQQPGSISCIHGIRFLSLTWVILGHLFAFCIGFVDNLTTGVPDFLQRWSFDAISNAFVSVDSFFTLSGLLVSYLTVSEMKKSGWKLNWGLFYFHRFWRLTPPYMLVIVLIVGLQQYCGQGPLWATLQPSDKTFCEKYWWTNLLYINNLVYRDYVCLGQSWYLANDMQFYVVSPLMIIPFYFNKFLGFVACGIFFLTHVITTGVLSTQHKWPATLVSANTGPNFQTYFQDYYETPWCRIGPYIVGIVTGYLLATQRDRIKLNWLRATIGWTVATAVALAALYGLHGDIGGKHPSTVEVAALYNALARSAWGACVCWVIVACVTGWGGFVNTLLSWSPFVVLGRLTYMAYLIHINLINIYFGNQNTLFHLTSLNISLIFMGVLVATYGISFVLMLALESPMIGLEKVFLPQRRKE